MSYYGQISILKSFPCLNSRHWATYHCYYGLLVYWYLYFIAAVCAFLPRPDDSVMMLLPSYSLSLELFKPNGVWASTFVGCEGLPGPPSIIMGWPEPLSIGYSLISIALKAFAWFESPPTENRCATRCASMFSSPCWSLIRLILVTSFVLVVSELISGYKLYWVWLVTSLL